MLYQIARLRHPCVVVAFTLVATLGSVASADAIPGVSSLQDLINLGSSPAAGVQVGTNVYYDFTYAGSPASSAPTATQITVTSVGSASGLSFAYGWSSTGGNNQSATISYSVKPADGTPQFALTNAALDFQSAVTPADPADNASVTETLASGFAPLADLNWFNASGTVNGVATNQHSTAFGSPLATLRVTDGIAVHTAAGSTGTSAISYVDNVFVDSPLTAPAPEPSLLIVPALGALTLMRRRRA